MQNKDEDVVKQMKRIVPEYISNNSIYEAMDEEILATYIYISWIVNYLAMNNLTCLIFLRNREL